MPRGRPRGSGAAIDKPKGRMSSYAYFVQFCRSEHKQAHPNESVLFAEFSKQCAERWKTMSPTEKGKFHELAEKDKIRYDNEMQDYVPPPGYGRRGRRSKNKIKDPNKPKRALSAFFYYANEVRSTVRQLNPDFTVAEIAKELGRRWNELSETEKSPHEKSAETDRARYDHAMKLYRSGELPSQNMNTNGHAPALQPVYNDYDEDFDDDEEI